MNNILSAVLVIGGVGLFFGIILAIASYVFEVKKDERAEKILAELPGANCGACGFAGCGAYADAIVSDGAEINCCSVGKEKVAKKIANIMGVEAKAVTEMVAKVSCAGNCSSVVYKYDYNGIHDCLAEAKLAGGAKQCPSGCLGLGSCVSVCQFGAISVVDGVAVVDPDKCTTCGQCLKKCPKGLIKFIPKDASQWVVCQNPEKGKEVNKYCKVGCIGCKLCEKACKFDAIHVENNHATIDYSKCKNCGACALKCPRGAIKSVKTLNAVSV